MSGQEKARAALTATGERRGSGAATYSTTGAIVPPIAGGSQDTALEFILWCLARGFKPIPLCWPDEKGNCACGRRDPKTGKPNPHQGNQVGKASKIVGWNDRDEHGAFTYNPSEDNLRFWLKQWPRCNWGIAMGPSGIVHVDPDSPEALQETLAKGTGVTIGRQSRNPSFLYRRTEGVPITNTTQMGASKKIDVLANGLAVAYGKHREGHDIYLAGDDLADVPEWAAAYLREARGASQDNPVTLPEDLPAVDVDDLPLSDKTKRRIREGDFDGFYLKEDGTTDRSKMLWGITTNMIGAGLDDATIAGTLRDPRNLGGAKAQECGRRWLERDLGRARDKYMEYPKLAFSRDPAGEGGGTIMQPPPLEGDEKLLAYVAQLEARITQLEAALVERDRQLEHERRQRIMEGRLQRNPHIKQERGTITALLFAHQSATSRGAVDDEGWFKCSRFDIAEFAGISKQTAGTHLHRLRDWGLAEAKLVVLDEPVINPTTGEKIYQQQYARLLGPQDVIVEQAATLLPERHDRKGRKLDTWGGPRPPRCPDHPDAEVTRKWVCTACNRVLGDAEDTEGGRMMQPPPLDQDIVAAGCVRTYGMNEHTHPRYPAEASPPTYSSGDYIHLDGHGQYVYMVSKRRWDEAEHRWAYLLSQYEHQGWWPETLMRPLSRREAG